MSDETLPVKAPPARDVTLSPSRINTDDFIRTFWVATVEPCVLRSDFLDPSFWAHIASKFRQFDRIEIRYDDGQAWGEFLVLSSDKTSAIVKEIAWKELSMPVKGFKDPRYSYKWRGPHAKHSIIRNKDNVVLIEKLPTQADALRWMQEYIGKL